MNLFLQGCTLERTRKEFPDYVLYQAFGSSAGNVPDDPLTYDQAMASDLKGNDITLFKQS